MNNKLSGTVLLTAYACCPDRGSEPGYGWNYLLQYANTFEKVILITSGHNSNKVTDKLREMGIDNITLIVLKIKFGLDRLHNIPVGGIHLHYFFWLFKVYYAVKKIPGKIDFAHHLTYGSLQFGSALYEMKCPFIFGPVGGGQRTNKIFYPIMGNARYVEAIRNLISYVFYRFNPFFKNTIRNASIIYCTNEETRQETLQFLASDQHSKVKMMFDTSLDPSFLKGQLVKHDLPLRFSILWVGRLLHRKGVEILLNIARLLRDENIAFTIVGDGPMREKVISFIKDHGLQNTVSFIGYVDQKRILDFYSSSDLMLFLSYRDSVGLQIMEAFSQGVPVISFDQFGASQLINEKVGIKIPLEKDLNALQEKIADTICELMRDRKKVQSMGRNAAEYAALFTWESKMLDILKDIKPFLKDLKPLASNENADMRFERV